jgi:tryptophan synthase alpha chain
MKLGIYFTIGDLGLKNSISIFKGLLHADVNLLEIGLPFSDPMLDGIVIQKSHTRAVKQNIKWQEICDALQEIKSLCKPNQQVSLMTTSQHLYDESRVVLLPQLDGILISDIRHNTLSPFSVPFKRVWFLNQEIVLKNKILHPPEDISMVYLTRVQGTTGENQRKEASTKEALQILKEKSDKDIWLGFGISTQKDILDAKELGADGAIIGASFVKKVTEYYFAQLSNKSAFEQEISLYEFSKNYILELIELPNLHI